MLRMLPTKSTWTSNRCNMFGFRPGILLSDFKIVTTSVQASGTIGTWIGSNPDRFGLFFWPNAIAPLSFGWQDANFTGTFQPFHNIQTPLAINFKDYGPLICLPWVVVSSGPPVTAIVTELIYQPRGGDLSAAKILKSGEIPDKPSVIQPLRQPTPQFVPLPPIGTS